MTYSANANGTGVADETDAGTYYVTAHYSGDANHLASDGNSIAIVINKASSTTTTLGAGPFTYSGNPQIGGAGTVSGANLSATAGSLTYSAHANGTGVADETDAGTYYVTAHYAGDANHFPSDGSAVAITINQAAATIGVSGYNVIYDRTSHTAIGTATGAGGIDLSADLTLGGTSHTNPGTYTGDTWMFHDPSGNYTDASGTVSDVIHQARANITVTPYNVTYDGTTHNATGTATGVGGVDLSGDLTLTGTTHTNAGTYTGDTWTFHDPSGNYADASGTVTDVINQASATTSNGAAKITVTPYNVTFDGKSHTATATATGAGGVDLSGDLTLTGTKHTSAGTYTGDTWTFHDPSGNYADASGTVTDVIGQATATITVTPYNVTYDGAAHTTTGTAAGVGGVDLSSDLTLSGTTHTSAGTHTGDTWTFHDPAGNYADASGTVTDVIRQATATITVTPYNVTFDGTSHTATTTATGAGGVDLSGDLTLAGTKHTSAGTYTGDNWSFHDPAGNYADASGTVTDTIGQATATVTVTPYSVTYDGAAHTAAGTATGVGGVDLSSNVTLTGTKHTSVGTYTGDTWTFHDPAGNYADANGTVTDVIRQATATIAVTPYHVTYDGNSHTATGTATGAGGVDFSSDLTLTGTKHTSAGTYTGDTWTFHDPAGNYADASGTVADVIGQATATFIVTPYSVTYDGAAHTAAGTATGVGGVDFSSDLTLTGTKHTSAGTYTGDTWTFHDPAGNYADASGSVTDVIGQATATITVTPYTLTYDGNSHTATGTATGAGGVDFSGDLTLVGTNHTSAGTYTGDYWSFHDPSGNYADASGTVTDVIKQATATIDVTPYNVTYDGVAHTAAGKTMGVGGVDLSSDLTLTGTAHTNAGTYTGDAWTFHDPAGNYADVSGTVTDVIKQATATIAVTPYNVTYDGNSHTATGTATGAGGVDFSSDLTLYGTTETNAGTYTGDNWSFHDPSGNYADASGTVTDVISQAKATITVTPYNVTYDGTVHTSTGTATGAGGVDLSPDLNLGGTTHTNAGTSTGDPWSFHDPAGNYADVSGTVTDVIQQATATIKVTPYLVTFDGTTHAATGTATGAGGVEISADLNLNGTIQTNAGTYPGDSWTFHDPSGNYADASGTVTDVISQATATFAVTPYNVMYDGTAHTATGTATGVGGVDFSIDLNLVGTTHTNAGTYTGDPWTFHDPSGNYADASGTVNNVINQATATINVTPYNVTYDGASHTAFAIVTGAGGVDLINDFSLDATTHTSAGTYSGDAWSFHDPAGNYADASGAVTDVIGQATATITVAPYSVTYDGNTHSASGSATGAGDVDLSADLNLEGTTRTDAGIYTADSWTFHDPSGNYADASGTLTDVIHQASSKTTTIGADPFTYNGEAQVAGSGTVSGVNLTTSAVMLTYSANADGTGVADQVDAGTYYVTAHYAGDANHSASDGAAVAVTINKASSITTTIGAGPYTYSGTAHAGGSGTVGGAGGLNSAATSITYSANADGTGTADLTDAGTYYVTAHYAGDANHLASDGAAVAIMINQATLTIHALTNAKVYDGTTTASAIPTVSGLIGSDTITGLSEVYDSKDVLGTNGSNLQVQTGFTIHDGQGGNNYTVNFVSAAGTITPAAITVAAVPYSKVYDGTTSVVLNPAGLFGSDTFVNLSETYLSKNVLGTGKSALRLNSGYSINDGNGGKDYKITVGATTAVGTITPAPLLIAATALTKTYDGTITAGAIPTFQGLFGSDSVKATESFGSRNVLGLGNCTLIVNPNYTISDGNQGHNYFVTTQSTFGTITPATLTISATTATKIYDTTTATTVLPKVTGLKGTDTVTGLSEAFQSKDVLGTSQSLLAVNDSAITVNDGNSGNNYSVLFKTAAGTIKPATLTLTAAPDSKVYDGTTASVATPTFAGLLGTDAVSGLTESYASKNVLGDGNSSLKVNSGYTISDGNNGHDYAVKLVAAPGTITPAALTISAVFNSKTYDAKAVAAAIPTVSGLFGTDTVKATEAYQSIHVLGDGGSTLLVSAYKINDGNTGKNYAVTLNTAAGTISPAVLTISAKTVSRVYDGTTATTVLPKVTGLKGTDQVTGLSESFQSKDVLGRAQSLLTVNSGYTVNDGNGGNDYTVVLNSVQGTITPATLTITAATDSKVYDGTTDSAAIPTVAGLFGTDAVSGLTESYVSKNVLGDGNSSLKVNSGYTISDGNNGLDYLVKTVKTPGTITPAVLTISAVTNTKTYDGKSLAAATPTVSGLIGTDTAKATEAYQSIHVLGDDGSTLLVSAYKINDGNSGKNYAVTLNTATGTISPAVLTISATTASRAYDGTTAATVLPKVAGLKGTDTVTGLSEAFQSKDVLGKAQSLLMVNPGYTVNDGNNGNDYTVNLNTAFGTITPATLIITAATDSKVYDGTTSSVATPTVAGLIGTDGLSGLTESYVSKNVLGDGNSSLTVNSGFTLSDGNNGHDYLVKTVKAAGTITPAALTISAVSNTKTYDGKAVAASTPTVSGLAGTDTVKATEVYQSIHVLGDGGSTLLVSSFTITDGNSGKNYAVTLNTAVGTINKANATLTITPYHVAFDGKSHQATGSAKGVLGETLSGLDVSGTIHSAAGTYSDTWTFVDTTGDYNNASGTITDFI